ANFHAEPVPDDATGADGEPLSDADRTSMFEGRVSTARTALEHTLGLREAALMRDLDDAADGTAGLLAAGPDSFVGRMLLPFFGGSAASPFAGVSGTSSAPVSDDDDDGGGLLGGLMGGLSDLGGG